MKVKLELEGLNGNALSLMGAFRKAAIKQGFKKEEIDKVLAECRSGDYAHLLETLQDNIEDE